MRLLKVSLLAIAVAQAACAEGPAAEPAPGADATVAVLLARAASPGRACEPTVGAASVRAKRGGQVVWQLADACGLSAGQTAQVSLGEWTFTGTDGRTDGKKHPFGPECRLEASVQAGGAANLACSVPVGADPGKYQYGIGLRVGETFVMKDSIIYIDE